MTRIVNVYNGDFLTDGQGGGIRYLRDLMAAQHSRGYEVLLMALGDGEPRNITIDNTPVQFIPISTDIRWPVFLFALHRHLRHHRESYRSAIIHCHRLYFAPVLRTIPDAHIVATIHTKTFAVFRERFPWLGWMLPLFIRSERAIIHRTIDQLSVAGASAAELYHHRHNIPLAQLPVLSSPSHIDPQQGTDQPSPIEEDSRTTVLCVGRLADVKRPLSVLTLFHNALKSRPSLRQTHRLIFTGGGPLHDPLAEAIRTQNLSDCVYMTGPLPSAQMPALYRNGQALILLSSSEVAPFTVKEALTFGLPVFATDVGIVHHYVPRQCGHIIPADAPENQTDALLHFLDSTYNPEDCTAQAAHIYAEESAAYDQTLTLLYERGTAP